MTVVSFADARRNREPHIAGEAFYHDGVPTDSEHPKRITVNKIEKALK